MNNFLYLYSQSNRFRDMIIIGDVGELGVIGLWILGLALWAIIILVAAGLLFFFIALIWGGIATFVDWIKGKKRRR